MSEDRRKRAAKKSSGRKTSVEAGGKEISFSSDSSGQDVQMIPNNGTNGKNIGSNETLIGCAGEPVDDSDLSDSVSGDIERFMDDRKDNALSSDSSGDEETKEDHDDAETGNDNVVDNEWAYMDNNENKEDDVRSDSSLSSPSDNRGSYVTTSIAMKSAVRHLQITDQHKRIRTTDPEATKRKRATSRPSNSPIDEENRLKMLDEHLAQENKDLQVGDFVYCPFPGTNPNLDPHYWGEIVDRREKADRTICFDVLFPDTDKTEDIASKFVYNWDYATTKLPRLGGYEKPPPEYKREMARRAKRQEANQGRKKYSCADLFRKRCGLCWQCKSRPDCGKCFTCKAGRVTECCIQKMCTRLDAKIKAQTCRPYLPDGFCFFFEAMRKDQSLKGLRLVSEVELTNSKFTKFTSFETVAEKYPTAFRNFDRKQFYEHIGLLGNNIRQATATTSPPSAPPASASASEDDEQQERPYSLRELQAKRCGRCMICKRARCGRCDSCRSMKNRDDDSGECCMRRMCLEIPANKRVQPAPCLGKGFKFYFGPEDGPKATDSDALRKLEGLWIVAPSGQRYRSVEDCVRSNRTVLAGQTAASLYSFYDRVGLELNGRDITMLRRLVTISGEEDDSQNGDGDGAIDVSSDAESQPSRKRARTAAPVATTADTSLVAAQSPEEATQTGTSAITPRVVPRSPYAMEEVRPDDPPAAKLWKRRCGICEFCKAVDCGQCQLCINNNRLSRPYREVCIYKMCLGIGEEDKLLQAEGFPTGWCFMIGQPNRALKGQGITDRLLGLKLFSPPHLPSNIFNTIESALKRLKKQFPENTCKQMKKHFLKFLGIPTRDEVINDPLMGKFYQQNWINGKGNPREVSGYIQKVEYDHIADENEYTVFFPERVRDLHDPANHRRSNGLFVPRTSVVNTNDAWGGCISYALAHSRDYDAIGQDYVVEIPDCEPEYTRWVVPSMYRKKMIKSPNGLELPQVVLVYNNFKLTFTVKQSSIKNAGYGVFLLCQKHISFDNREYFELEPCNLLDFGVYAPHREGDKRGELVFLIKSFVHGFACEKYSFETGEDNDYQIFDITDDCSGYLHVEAARHVPPYVNETTTDMKEPAQVHTRYNCEGALHYLLGHEKKAQGTFRFPCDIEKEIFVDYGDGYEEVRVRNGYSRKNVSPSEVQQRIQSDSEDYVREIDRSSANEVKEILVFAKKVVGYCKDRTLDVGLMNRTVVVLIMVNKRSKRMMRDFQQVREPSNVSDNGASDLNLEKVISLCQELLKVLCDIMSKNDDTYPDSLRALEVFKKLCVPLFPPHVKLEEIDKDTFQRVLCEY